MRQNKVNYRLYRGVFGFFSLLIVVIFLSGCNFPALRSTDSSIFDSAKPLETKPVNIQFILLFPEPNSQAENIVIELLDDVTGLPYNNRRYSLNELSEQTYGVTLSIPSGSVIKYRYGKLQDSFIPEVDPMGEPITYRLYYASGSDRVTDILQGWQGETTVGNTGRITGIILDDVTHQPIPDILISAGGQRTFTDSNGKFAMEGLTQGLHNVVFYAMDGKYRPYQQGAVIQSGMNTPADVKLTPMPLVNVSFHVTTPTDALGAPISMAGNIVQMGNTFSELYGSMSIKPKRMPTLSSNQDGTHSITLQLYAETDLRYKYTLGDGYWNAEQYDAGGFRVRQLIVPSEDVTIEQKIETWRSKGIEPITFAVSIPSETTPIGEKYIQFQAKAWTEPIPLWPLGNGDFLYILYSPLEPSLSLNYRFCRNEDCLRAADADAGGFERQVQPSNAAQTINLTLDSWQNWYTFENNASVMEAFVPQKPSQYGTMMEMTPEMNPSWQILAPSGISNLSDIHLDTIIFSPQWMAYPNSPYIQPVIGTTPYFRELIKLLNDSSAQGFENGLFPQLGDDNTMETWWSIGPHPEAWWKAFFTSYRDFILNYANIAQISGTDTLLLGGKSLLPAFEGGVFPDGSDSNVPINFDKQWLDLLSDVRSVFDGKMIWATNASIEMDPLPGFIYEFDGIYISIDSPLAFGEHPNFDTIQSGFVNVIDSQIYEVYRSTGNSITLALAYPAVDSGPSGCALLNDRCYNDGLFLAHNIAPFTINFEEQALIYNAILPIIASRDWITGVSIRGYDPVVSVHDGTSSIAGKPAYDVIKYWFNNMKP